MIKLQNVSKSFGSTRAVSDLSFEVRKGEIIGLLGPNGAGKTTTMRLMTGFLLPDTGAVEIDGTPVGFSPEVQTKIGYLPENNPLYKDMLVGELLEFSAKLKGLTPESKKEALDFAVKAVGIEKVYYRPIRELSKGYRQRVGMAMALLARPDVLVMDEPTEGLDPNQRAEIRSLIKSLAKDRTIILSTHVMAEAAAVCSRLLIISKGKLVADGSPESLSKNFTGVGTVLVELEGANVKQILSSTQNLAVSDLKDLAGGRVQAQLASKGDPAQRVISHLARENNWIIWKMTESGRGLEDIFQSLTERTY